MGRRYYCDYCDKTFIDDIDARKKHLNSALHQKIRNEHYLACRDPRTILAEEIVKQPCYRYQQTGTCQFLDNCKYTHYTQEELYQLKIEVDYLELQEQEKLKEKSNVPTLESWLEKYKKKKGIENRNIAPTVWWGYPDILLKSDLSPSLLKFKPEHFTDGDFETWG